MILGELRDVRLFEEEVGALLERRGNGMRDLQAGVRAKARDGRRGHGYGRGHGRAVMRCVTAG